MFDKLFDKMDKVFEKPVAAELETITLAAIRDESGKVWTGPDHGTILNKMEDAGYGFVRYAGSTATYIEIEDGFMTSTGRFVDRREAALIAQKANQRKHPRGGILTHDQLESMDQLK